ncbi:MAG: hypothetical protein ACOX7G_06540 [Candidatus Scatomorpha sp.]
MAKIESITAESYVRINGKLTNTKALSIDQRRELAAWIKLTYLNSLFEGKAKFYSTESK